MNKEFVPYELAVKLKELGFDESCFTYYYEDTGKIRTGISIHIHNGWTYSGTKRLETTLAPTFSQSFRFFREKYNILATIYSNASGYLYEWHDAVGGTHRGWSEYEGPNDGGVWDTYEEAELACFQKLIEIVEQQNQK